MAGNSCALCAKGKEGCVDCCTSAFKGYPGVMITLSDAARLAKASGKPAGSFTKIVRIGEDDILGENPNYPFYGKVTFNNKLLYLHGKNRCPFLGKDGCEVFSSRPMMCRLHPFWFRLHKGRIRIIIEWESISRQEKCYICRKNYKNKDVKFLLSLIGETETSMKRAAEQFIKELELHNKLKYQLESKTVEQVLKDNKMV